MEFTDVIKKRKSVRSYKPNEISQDILQKLFEALQIAPTGVNKQKFKFIFVKDPQTLAKIAIASEQKFVGEAPLIMVAAGAEDYKINTTIAVDHMILEATNQGLGTCWIGWFDRQQLKDILSIPEGIEAIIMVTIGYAASKPKAKCRKSIEELISWDKY